MKNLYNENGLHERIINFLILIDRVCKKNQIKYSLHGGTLLGAERNGKLIPWDEDADISMLRSQINKLLVLEKGGFLPFSIERGQLAPWLTSFVNTELDGSKTYIDVFIWDYISDSYIKQLLKINLLRFLQGMMKKSIDYSSYSKIQSALVFIAHSTGLLMPINLKVKLYDLISIYLFVGNRNFIHRSNDAYVGVSYIFDSDYMKYYTFIKLENRDFMAASRYKEFLIRNYGDDYMIPPKEVDRKTIHGHNKTFLPKSERGGLFSIRK